MKKTEIIKAVITNDIHKLADRKVWEFTKQIMDVIIDRMKTENAIDELEG